MAYYGFRNNRWYTSASSLTNKKEIGIPEKSNQAYDKGGRINFRVSRNIIYIFITDVQYSVSAERRIQYLNIYKNPYSKNTHKTFYSAEP